MLNNRNIKIIKLNKLFNYKNFDFLKIINIYENSIYELKLLILIKRLHFIFYSQLFYLNNNDSLFK